MIYKIFYPSFQVQEYVQWYHLLHFKFGNSTVKPVKLYFPHAEQCLTFDPKGRVDSINSRTGQQEKRAFSYLSPQQTSAYQLGFEEEYLMLKVVFKPGGLFRLLSIPMTEFGNRYIDAELVIPAEVQRVNEQLAYSKSYTEMIDVVERYLKLKIKNVRKPPEPIDRVLNLVNIENIHSIEALASHACLSVRQLERKYLERVGVSPKLYNRILRFNKAFKMKENNAGKSWFSIAIDCGYTDLQHLIKDFKQFSNSTPSELILKESTSIHRQFNLA
ncbi:MAG TPA: helix-turn-helix domain-containing protein [Ohtaekwangia sp.]|nr:helix-turn-helix domain-containing protein [Ohtaekwangia sp.]